jgi:hypothetical protein
MYPVIVCIAKKEHYYIEEFVKYHLALGFKYIYIYDNEDIPTYDEMLAEYEKNIKVIHFPFNTYSKPVQDAALDDFVKNYLFATPITHATHIDIDEFIVLKKHSNICDFINEYIVDDCEGIGMNWRFFGSSGKTEKTDEPVTSRFTMCEKNGNKHIKTLFKKDNFIKYHTCHNIQLSKGHIKSTNKAIIGGPFNEHIDFNVIQLNHYKSKTLAEYRYIRLRGRADWHVQNHYTDDEIKKDFELYDINEIEDLNACNFYKNISSSR